MKTQELIQYSTLSKLYEEKNWCKCDIDIKHFICNIIQNNRRRKEETAKKRKSYLYKHYKQNKCKICETSINVKTLHIHHIDEDHTNNKKNNLLTVCAECHIKIHIGKRGKKSHLPLTVFADVYI